MIRTLVPVVFVSFKSGTFSADSNLFYDGVLHIEQNFRMIFLQNRVLQSVGQLGNLISFSGTIDTRFIPMATVTNYHEFGGLKQHKLILLQF